MVENKLVSQIIILDQLWVNYSLISAYLKLFNLAH